MIINNHRLLIIIKAIIQIKELVNSNRFSLKYIPRWKGRRMERLRILMDKSLMIFQMKNLKLSKSNQKLSKIRI
jgi:hypothetical protein